MTCCSGPWPAITIEPATSAKTGERTEEQEEGRN